MQNYGFVYIWYDRKHKRFYIGCHWGREDDGYVCSSPWMKSSYKRRPEDFKRRIISRIYSNRADMFDEESRWHKMISDEDLGTRYYNFRRHGDQHWSRDPNKLLTVGQKISASPERNANISKALKAHYATGNSNLMRPDVIAKKIAANTGRKKTPKEQAKRSASLKGHSTSVETREKIRAAHLGKNKPPLTEERKTRISQANIGRKHSDETLLKMSQNSKGKHGGTVMVTDKAGINKRISKQLYDAQKIGKPETWEYVSVSSQESKNRRVKTVNAS